MTLIKQVPSTSGTAATKNKEEKKSSLEQHQVPASLRQLSTHSLLDNCQNQQQQQQQQPQVKQNQGPLWAHFVALQSTSEACNNSSTAGANLGSLFACSSQEDNNAAGAHDQIWLYYNQQQQLQQQQDQQAQQAQEEAQAKEKKKKKKKRRNSFDSIFSLNSEFDEFEGQTVRFKPESIDNLVKLTKFNKRELKLMYRGFKQLCPSGVVKEDKFKLIYAQFFPRGAETNHYARFVFNTFDVQRKQEITFTDFVIGLSVLTRGTIEERLRWIFTLYDINGDGVITKDELSKIVCSIYDLMGKLVDQPSDEITAREQTDRLFKKFDLNCDGIITLDEFLESCHNDENIIKSISVFNTVL